MNSYTEESDESDYSDYDDDTEGFNCTNMDPALAKLMGVMINEDTNKDAIDWKPPSFSGLTNSNNIVNGNKIEFESVVHKIKNFVKLNKEELEFITQLSGERKQIIIEVYNDLIK